MPYIQKNTPADLRNASTAGMSNYAACLLGDPGNPDELTWFFIDRLNTAPDDGNRVAGWSAIKCLDGDGNWVVITPATYGLAAELNNPLSE